MLGIPTLVLFTGLIILLTEYFLVEETFFNQEILSLKEEAVALREEISNLKRDISYTEQAIFELDSSNVITQEITDSSRYKYIDEDTEIYASEEEIQAITIHLETIKSWEDKFTN
jgi:hypothetical protein